jgi:TPR repeat protein
MRRFFFAVFVIIICAANVEAASIEEATFAYDSGDYTRAARLFRPLAEQGSAPAQLNLGKMHARGQGVRQDYQAALKWFHKAAEQGDVSAQNNLGLMYERGRGARQNFVLAYMWSSIAAAAISDDEGKAAMKRRDHVASKMTAAQIEKAQEMARRCQDTQFKQCD